MSKKYVYIGIGTLTLIALGIVVDIKVNNKTHMFRNVLYVADSKPDIMTSVPVWMREKPEIKAIVNNIYDVYEYQKQHSCIANDYPPDKIQCDSLDQRMNGYNKQLQDEIHNLNIKEKSPRVMAAAVNNIKNLREDQTLEVQLTDVLDNPYSDNGKNVDLYQDNKGMEYMVDAATNQVVQFVARAGGNATFKQTPKLTVAQLKQKTEEYLAKHIPDFNTIKTDYAYTESTKDNSSYAFRWDAKTKPQGADLAPFIQVVLSPAGDVMGFNDIRSLYIK